MIRKIFAAILFACFLVGASYAQDSTDQNGMPSQGEQGMGQPNGQPPAPPQFAIDACKGKSEGATCQTDKVGAGVCDYTPDKKYFACKPNNMPSGGRRGPIGPEGPSGNEVRDNQDGTTTSMF
jgi:hypothetical protein